MADHFNHHREPELVFQPLNDRRYTEFYDLEVARFQEDLIFYRQYCSRPNKILELGCGSGRLCHVLAADGAGMTGIDLNLTMLVRARKRPGPSINYLQMDMNRLGLKGPFDTIIIAYNTLNLLQQQDVILSCLRQTASLLRSSGFLLLQLYIPDQALLNIGDKRLFQFQSFDLPHGGRVIKETLKGYSASKQCITLEERYRVRPMQPGTANEDLSHTLHLAALSHEQWIAILHKAGFIILEQFGGYDFRPYDGGTCLLVHGRKST
mgnify:CR=1 FL=1